MKGSRWPFEGLTLSTTADDGPSCHVAVVSRILRGFARVLRGRAAAGPRHPRTTRKGPRRSASTPARTYRGRPPSSAEQTPTQLVSDRARVSKQRDDDGSDVADQAEGDHAGSLLLSRG